MIRRDARRFRAAQQIAIAAKENSPKPNRPGAASMG
jgi:hypothetical protein